MLIPYTILIALISILIIVNLFRERQFLEKVGYAMLLIPFALRALGIK